MTKIKALFVDRDGTLIEDKHYLSDPAGVCLLPTVGDSLKTIHEAGIQIFIVTNQSGIGRGYFTEEDFWACQEELAKQLAPFGVTIVDTAFCPHDPSENCTCRKPNLGMWEQLAKKHGLNPSECAMIGDKKEDVGFGVNAGFALSCLISTGKGMESAKKIGISFEENTVEFSSSLITDRDTPTKCFAVLKFENVIKLILRAVSKKDKPSKKFRF